MTTKDGIITVTAGALEALPLFETNLALGGTIMQRVALFVDGANMFYAQRDNGWFIDFRAALQYFTDNKEKAVAYYFTATPHFGDQEKVKNYRRFRSALQGIGFSVVDKEVRVISTPDSGIVKVKGNLDIELVFRILTEQNTYDEAVLMGGDSDYIPIVSHLRALGKIVTVVGRRQSVSNDLINVANKFVDLNSIRDRIEREKSTKHGAAKAMEAKKTGAH